MKYPVNFTLNGVPVEAYVKPTETLLDVIREHLNIKSPKRGCDSGDCGTCTVLLNGQPIRSCLTIALTMNGKQITTVEGLTVQGQAESHPGGLSRKVRRPVRFFARRAWFWPPRPSWIKPLTRPTKKSKMPCLATSAVAALMWKPSRPSSLWLKARGRSRVICPNM